MPKKADTREVSPRQSQEDLAFLRSKCGSLTMRGHYVECVKVIEENLHALYHEERWPEQFFSMLRMLQKCYPSTGRDQSLEEHLTPLLRKNDIPVVFAKMLQERDTNLVWTAEHFQEQALQCENRGDLETALAYSELMVKTEPGSANACLAKGRILDKLGRNKLALEMYELALELSPGNRHALSLLARHYLNGNPKQALEWVKKAIEKTPDDAANYGLLAEVLCKMGDEEGAIVALNDAMRMDPYNAAFPFQKAEILFGQDKRVAAIPLYRMALALDAEHVPSLMRMTELSREVQPELALTYASTAANLEPENRDALHNKATLLVRTGNPEAALRQYRALLELDENNGDAHGGLGIVYRLTGEAQKAIAHLEKAVAAAPKDVSYHLEKARAHRQLDQSEEAIQEFKSVTALDESCADAWGELGSLTAAKKPEEALGYYAKALAVDPKNPNYLTGKGELLLAMPGRHEDAIAALSLACQYHPGDAALHVRVGKLLEEDGNIASAMEHYRKALNITPDDAEIHYLIARSALETRPDEALGHISAAIAHSVTRGDYYYIKAKAIVALIDDPECLDRLEQAAMAGEGTVSFSEISDIRGEEGPRTALVFIDRAIEMDPGNPLFLCMRANLFHRMGQLPKALEQYDRLLKKNPDQPEALYGMAQILAEKKGEEKRALDYYDKAIACAPAVAEYHAGKASLLARDENRYEQALEEYAAAIAINNQLWRVILEKAQLLDDHGDTTGAMSEYRRALLIRPDIAAACGRMGELLADISSAAAFAYLDHAVKLEPENYLYNAWRGRVYHSLGESDKGEADLAAALVYGGDSPEVFFTLATVLAKPFPYLALPYCQQAVEGDSTKAGYHLLLGDLLLRRDELDGAREALTTAVALDGGCHEAREKLARVALLQGDPQAEALIAAALASKVDCPGCLYTKACLMEARGDDTGALELMRQVVKIMPDDLSYREKLVELLAKKHSLLKLAVERRRLEKLRRELEQPMEIPEPPAFSEMEEESAAG